MIEKRKPVESISWTAKDLSHLDPRTRECDYEIQRIIHLQAIVNRLPDAFNDAAKVTKSHIPASNVLARIIVLEEHVKMDDKPTNLKFGRPMGSKDIVH
jgi:hypothetical protein